MSNWNENDRNRWLKILDEDTYHSWDDCSQTINRANLLLDKVISRDLIGFSLVYRAKALFEVQYQEDGEHPGTIRYTEGNSGIHFDPTDGVDLQLKMETLIRHSMRHRIEKAFEVKDMTGIPISLIQKFRNM